MLKPEYLENAPQVLIELYSQAEQDILADMARRISTYDYYIPAAEHQRQMLREAGLLQSEIISALSRLTGKSERELQKLMKQAADEALENDRKYYNRYGIDTPSDMSEQLINILNTGYKGTKGMFRNLSKTTAQAGQSQFITALDRAWFQISSGAFDYNTAIRYAVKDLSKQGLNSVKYPSGRTDSIEVAVRRATVTGINQTALQLSDRLADEVGCDLVETTAHAGARPSHAEWQGKIFSRSGKHKKYPSLRASTGYGTGDGLGGWNCRHSYNPYVEDAPRAYSEEQLEQFNARTIEYNGKMYTEYEASQIQRYHERQIRRWKRENIAMSAARQDTAESAAKIKFWQDKQKSFIEHTKLKRQADRELVAGFGKNEAKKAAEKAKRVESKANSLYNLGSTEKNVAEYIKYKAAHDEMEANGIEFIQWIYKDKEYKAKEAIVKVEKPIISGERKHAIENRETKSDRKDMTVERAQGLVNNSKIVLYQVDKHSIKFIAQDGYAVLNFNNELITSVPQKWRKKYDKYLGGM